MGYGDGCGIVGIYSIDQEDNILVELLRGLHALQHRGEESAGIALSNSSGLSLSRSMGWVSDLGAKLSQHDGGHIGIGHTRYSTRGSSTLVNAQPFLFDRNASQFALAHSGNITNYFELVELVKHASIELESSSDSEVAGWVMTTAGGDSLLEKVLNTVNLLEGAYSFVILTKNEMFGVRDKYGIRPLSIGHKDSGYWALASETCALDAMGFEYVRDVQPGEIVRFSRSGMSLHKFSLSQSPSYCVYEHLYFSRDDSIINNISVYSVRRKLGKKLAELYPVDADIVIPIPDSGRTAALGYSEESGIPYSNSILRHAYVGRSFIQPDKESRIQKASMKFSVVAETVAAKRVIVVDDSIVRGNVLRIVVEKLKSAGAKEIHVRTISPPMIGPCYYGLDTPEAHELVAVNVNPHDFADHFGVTSIGMLPLKFAASILEEPLTNFCTACFTLNYPIPVKGL